MTTNYHESNRICWDAAAKTGRGQIDTSNDWQDCYFNPCYFFCDTELEWFSDVTNKKICVLGSGDNIAAFALTGLGAIVTSVDFSAEQISIAARRAEEIGININFICTDVTNLTEIPDNSFDYVYTGGHVAVWVSDLKAYYSEAIRILKPDGFFIVNEYHPFRRAITVNGQYEYFNRGPFCYDKSEDIAGFTPGTLPSYEFHWTISDYITAILDTGAVLLKINEFGDEHEDWEDINLAGMPLSLLLLARKQR
jgi:SAM-dependent methyltransferase